MELSSLHFRKNAERSAVSTILRDLSGDKVNFREYSLGVVDKLVNTELVQSKEEKNLVNSLEVLYKTVIVLYMSYLPQSKVELFQTPEELIGMYPEFAFDKNCESELWYDLAKEATRMKKKRNVTEIEGELRHQHAAELDRLLIFRNFMRLSLVVIPPEGNKNILLKVTAKLEGAGQSYITGGDPRPATRRRIRIYERESGIKAKRKNSSGNTFSAQASNTATLSSVNTLNSSSNSNLQLFPSYNADSVGSDSPSRNGGGDFDSSYYPNIEDQAAAAITALSHGRYEDSPLPFPVTVKRVKSEYADQTSSGPIDLSSIVIPEAPYLESALYTFQCI